MNELATLMGQKLNYTPMIGDMKCHFRVSLKNDWIVNVTYTRVPHTYIHLNMATLSQFSLQLALNTFTA